MLKKTLSGVCAGILISIGGSVFLACVNENKFLAAILFSVALLCICVKGYSLYTGKIGYIPESHSPADIGTLLFGLLGNIIGTVLCGLLISVSLTNLGITAENICTSKLTQSFLSTFVRGIFCGILMYLAVSIYRDKKSYIGILFCIPVFILSGFEHSVADMFYFASARMFSFDAVKFIFTVVLGNTVGAWILPTLGGLWTKKAKEADKAPAPQK